MYDARCLTRVVLLELHVRAVEAHLFRTSPPRNVFFSGNREAKARGCPPLVARNYVLAPSGAVERHYMVLCRSIPTATVSGELSACFCDL